MQTSDSFLGGKDRAKKLLGCGGEMAQLLVLLGVSTLGQLRNTSLPAEEV